MHIEHIFESGHPVTTTLGWIIFLVACAWFGVLLPYAYDAWLINKRIDLANVSPSFLKRREGAIDRLTEYYHFVISHTCYRNPSNVLNDFAKHLIWICIADILLILVGAFFPTVTTVIGKIILFTM